MTLFSRAAVLAALSLGIVGLAGMSVPGSAAQSVSETISDNAPIAQLILPATVGFNIPPADTNIVEPMPSVAAVAGTPAPVPAVVRAVATDRIQPTALDTVDDDPKFQSLADAVAQQVAPAGVSDELRCLAGAIYYEAKGEPLAGQLAVAEVIINRTRSGRFPRSLCGVVTQAGQFGFVRGGVIPAINPASTSWRTAVAVAQVALDEAWESPAADAMFFHARYVRPGWAKPRLASIGNHVFYR